MSFCLTSKEEYDGTKNEPADRGEKNDSIGTQKSAQCRAKDIEEEKRTPTDQLAKDDRTQSRPNPYHQAGEEQHLRLVHLQMQETVNRPPHSRKSVTRESGIAPVPYKTSKAGEQISRQLVDRLLGQPHSASSSPIPASTSTARWQWMWKRWHERNIRPSQRTNSIGPAVVADAAQGAPAGVGGPARPRRGAIGPVNVPSRRSAQVTPMSILPQVSRHIALRYHARA
jgi:hypothetical protein